MIVELLCHYQGRTCFADFKLLFCWPCFPFNFSMIGRNAPYDQFINSLVSINVCSHDAYILNKSLQQICSHPIFCTQNMLKSNN